MAVKGQGTKSIRKKSLTNTRNPVVGVKNIKFHHKASAGEQYIDITNLNTVGTGLQNPAPDVLAKARLKDFEENLVKFTSSAKGELMDGSTLAFQFISNTTIKLNFEAEEGEIFTLIFNNAVINGTVIADVRTPGSSGTLLEGQRDFALGESIPINDLTNDWPIGLFRGVDGKPMLRNTGNAEYTGDDSIGNYQMIDDGTGHCSVVRMNIAGDVGGEPMFWANHGALGERPNLSVLQQLEAVMGILDVMADDLLEASGNDIEDPTRYDGRPTYADLRAFGDKVQQNIKDIADLQTPIRNEVWVSEGNLYGSTNTGVRRWNRIRKNIGSAITYADSATLGASFTINEDGLYKLAWSVRTLANADDAITLNQTTQLNVSVGSFNVTNQDKVLVASGHPTGGTGNLSTTLELKAGDVLRPMTAGVESSAPWLDSFRITKVGE